METGVTMTHATATSKEIDRDRRTCGAGRKQLKTMTPDGNVDSTALGASRQMDRQTDRPPFSPINQSNNERARGREKAYNNNTILRRE
jgi:hypothetical protein